MTYDKAAGRWNSTGLLSFTETYLTDRDKNQNADPTFLTTTNSMFTPLFGRDMIGITEAGKRPAHRKGGIRNEI